MPKHGLFLPKYVLSVLFSYFTYVVLNTAATQTNALEINIVGPNFIKLYPLFVSLRYWGTLCTTDDSDSIQISLIVTFIL